MKKAIIPAPVDERCPHCRSAASIIPYVSVVVSFDNWPLILGFLAIIIAFGIEIGLTTGVIFGFGALAILPVVVNIAKRQMCHQCGMQFSFTKETKKHTL